MNVGALTGTTLGPYQLLEVLGEGAIGFVYHGYHPGLQRHVAIKVLKTVNVKQATYAERFAIEAHTVSNLRHPHIVPIYEYGSDKGFHFIVMRLLTGGTLEERLEQRSLLPSLGESAQLLNQVADALTYAHERGVVHRDVKPTNVMFDERGLAFLVDFGIVKLLNTTAALTTVGAVVGTPSFMAPEQWRGEVLTPAADQYALGVIAYQLVSGCLPFEADSMPALMYKQLHETPKAVSEVPEAVDRVLQWALAKDPLDRYPSVLAFAEAFRAAVEGAEGEPTNFFKFPLDSKQPTESIYPSIPLPPAQSAVMPLLPVPKERRSAARPLAIGAILGLLAVALCIAALVLGGLSLLGQPDATDTPQSAASSAPTLQNTPTTSPTAEFESAITASNAVQLQEQAVLTTDDTSVRAIAFDPNGQRLASGGNSNTVQLWNVNTGSREIALPGHSGVIFDIAFSPDGSRIATASEDGSARLWDSDTGRGLFTLRGHIGEVRSVVFSPDGRMLASAGEDQTVRLWDANSGSQIHVLRGVDVRVLGITFSPDGRQLFTGWTNNAIAVWDTSTWDQQMQLPGHMGEIRALAVNPQATLLASASADDTVRLWDARTGQSRFALTGHGRDVFACAFTPDGSVLASGAADTAIRLWNAETGEALATLSGHGGWVFDVQFNSDGALLASAGGDGTVRLWGF